MAADLAAGQPCPALATQQLDPTALTRLSSELESTDLARSIARTYLRMLEGRLARASLALDRRDDIAAMDVLLSLRVSSATVGLVRLESAVLCVIDAVRRGDREQARDLGASMARIAPEAGAVLQAHLDVTATGRQPAAVERTP